MLPLEKLEQLARRYGELDELLCRPDVLADRNQLNKLNKERSDLEPLINQFSRYRDLTKKIKDDEEARNDPELKELVEMELPELNTEKTNLEKTIQLLLLPPDPNDKKNTV